MDLTSLFALEETAVCTEPKRRRRGEACAASQPVEQATSSEPSDTPTERPTRRARRAGQGQPAAEVMSPGLTRDVKKPHALDATWRGAQEAYREENKRLRREIRAVRAALAAHATGDPTRRPQYVSAALVCLPLLSACRLGLTQAVLQTVEGAGQEWDPQQGTWAFKPDCNLVRVLLSLQQLTQAMLYAFKQLRFRLDRVCLVAGTADGMLRWAPCADAPAPEDWAHSKPLAGCGGVAESAGRA